MDEMTKKFNKLTEELKSMFTVSQAMAKNSFDTTLKQPVEGETGNPDPIPDHEYPKQQPTAGDFTKECRAYISGSSCMSETSCKGYAERLHEACARLDRAEAINKDLLEACVRLLLYSKCDSSCVDRQEAQAFARTTIAIAKAKKEQIPPPEGG